MRVTSRIRLDTRDGRDGLTLPEVLVCVVIIGVLATLLLPAVTSQRVHSRRQICLNNVKNVAISIGNFGAANGGPLPALASRDRTSFAEGDAGASAGGLVVPIGSGDPEVFRGTGWPVTILPYFDQRALYEEIASYDPRFADSEPLSVESVQNDQSASLSIDDLLRVPPYGLVCPENDEDEDTQLSYVVNAGYWAATDWNGSDNRSITSPTGQPASFWAATEGGRNRHSDERLDWVRDGDDPTAVDRRVARATGAFVPQRDGGTLSLDDISRGDGATQTLLVAENIQATVWSSPFARDIAFGIPIEGIETSLGRVRPFEADRLGGCGSRSSESVVLDPFLPTSARPRWLPSTNASADEGMAPRPSSRHEFVNVAFADFHVRGRGPDIDPDVYRRLVTADGTAFGEEQLDDNAF